MFLEDKIKTIADEPKDPAGSKPESSWKNLVNKIVPGSQGSSKAPIDAFRTKDFNLFHELTHAPVGAGTTDVDGGDSYYWSNVRRISDRKDASSTRKASYNAENFAYYAIGAWLISPNEGATPQRPMSDGTIEVLHPKSDDNTKRSLVAPRDGKKEVVKRHGKVYTTMKTIKTVITELKTIPITVTPSDDGKPSASSGSKSAPTTSAPITTGTQTTVVAVTSADTTSSVTFVAAPLPSGKGKWGWRCKGALCNPKCLFPILCKGTGGSDGGGGGTWGLKSPWKPKPPPGGGPVPPDGPQPEPTPETEPDDNKPSNTNQKSESKRTSSKHASSASSCKPTTTSTCDKIVSSYTKNDKVYTTTVENKDKCTTVTKCSASVNAKTSTASDAAEPTVNWTDSIDDLSDQDWENSRDKLLAAMIADKTDSTLYYAPEKTGSGSSSSSAKPSHSKSSSSGAKPSNSKASSSSHKVSPASSTASKLPTKSNTPTFKAESCGKDKTEVREHTDFVQDNISLYDPFCKGLDTSKQQNSTVISTFGIVSFGYVPSKTKKQAFEYNCSDALYSLSIGCAGMYPAFLSCITNPR